MCASSSPFVLSSCVDTDTCGSFYSFSGVHSLRDTKFTLLKPKTVNDKVLKATGEKLGCQGTKNLTTIKSTSIRSLKRRRWGTQKDVMLCELFSCHSNRIQRNIMRTTTVFSALCPLLPKRQGTIGEYHRRRRARSFASLNACTPKE